MTGGNPSVLGTVTGAAGMHLHTLGLASVELTLDAGSGPAGSSDAALRLAALDAAAGLAALYAALGLSALHTALRLAVLAAHRASVRNSGLRTGLGLRAVDTRRS